MSRSRIEADVGGVSIEHYAAVGKVVSFWSILELLINSELWNLVGLDKKQAACITSQIPNASRSLDTYVSLVLLLGGSIILVKRISKFIEVTHAIAEQRNRVVHDPWVTDKTTKTHHRMQVSAKKRLVFDYVVMETEDIEEVADLIRHQINRFNELRLVVVAELLPLRDKLPEASLPPRLGPRP